MWAPSWGWVILANVLLGINQGLTWSTTVIMKIDLAGPAKRGLAMGLNEFAGYLAVVLLSFALVFALSNVMDPGWAALIVAVIWAIIGAVLYANGRKKLKDLDPVPRRTVDTIKEDAQWLKNPTG